MKNKFKTSILVGLLTGSLYVQAEETIYGGEFLSSNSHTSIFPSLDLSQPTYAKLKVTNSFEMNKRIDQLVLQFKNANTLEVNNFRSENGRYIAIVEDAWVFSKLLVIVENVDFDQPDNFTVRLEVVEHSSTIDELMYSAGVELAAISGVLIDQSPKKIVDKATLLINDKELTLTLAHRVGRYTMDLHNMPIPGYDEGFEVEATWMGKGVKKFFIPSSGNGHVNNNVTPIGFNIDVHEVPTETMRYISINYSDNNGNSSATSMHMLNDILRQAFNTKEPF
jgi:hypothetical protein